LFKLKENLDLKQIESFLNGKLIGKNKNINNIGSLQDFDHKSIIFLKNEKFFNETKISPGLIVTSETIYQKIPKSHTFILVTNPSLSMSKFLSLFKHINSSLRNSDTFNYKNTTFESNCIVGKNVVIGKGSKFGANIVIEDNVTIGQNVTIGSNVVIHHGSFIGNNVVIQSGSIIGSEGFGNILNNSQEWVHIPHLGDVVIGNNVSIGSNSSIDRGTIGNTIISDGVIIDNLVHIAHNVFIGENTAIAAKVGIAGSSKIGKRNMIGGMVGIINHITTVDDVTISPTSTVIRDIKKSGVYTGIMPTTEHNLWKRLATFISKLDKISSVFKNKGGKQL